MEFSNKNILVIGAARSGIPTTKALKRLGAIVTLNDVKKREDLGSVIDELSNYIDHFDLGGAPKNIEQYDKIVVSPGVPLDLPFFNGVESKIMGEIELSYQIAKGKFVGITGTNGKSTTTVLTGDMYKRDNRDSHVVGNIGLAAVTKAFDGDEDTIFVTEISSFQLESIHDFHAPIAAVLNMTEDHLNRHKTMECYQSMKMRVFKNQTADDVVVLNYDNDITRSMASEANGRVMFFSITEDLDQGCCLVDDYVTIKDREESIRVIHKNDIFIPGNHNLENAMAASLLAYLGGVSIEAITESLREFQGIAHRLEYLGVKEGITYYNDSKGTNVDSSIKAVLAMKKPTVLIAGGMDKGSSFDEFIESFTENIKGLVLFGETKELIKTCAIKHGFTNIYVVDDLDQAVEVSREIVEADGTIILSPACASWDMYSSFEARGDHFKSIVERI